MAAAKQGAVSRLPLVPRREESASFAFPQADGRAPPVHGRWSWTFHGRAIKLANGLSVETSDSSLIGEILVSAFPKGTVHEAGEDFEAAVRADPKVLALWENLSPLGRNEFICWIDDAKQPATRRRRISRARDELLEGKKRPCCWAGCVHRIDKAPSRWQQAILIDGKPKNGS